MIKKNGKLIPPSEMKSIRKGDRFTEMYCFWLYVIKTTKNDIYYISASTPCDFPKDGKKEVMTKVDFVKRFYFVDLCSRNEKVDGWVDPKECLRVEYKRLW